jgi:hypothetical protein
VRSVADDDHGVEAWNLVEHGLERRQVLGLDDRHPGAAVGEDVLEKPALQTEVDRYLDGSAETRPPPRLEILRAVARHDEHGVALANPESLKGAGKQPGALGEVTVRDDCIRKGDQRFVSPLGSCCPQEGRQGAGQRILVLSGSQHGAFSPFGRPVAAGLLLRRRPRRRGSVER